MSFDTPLPPYNASDPHAHFLNTSCLDLLLIEIVPLAERMARHVSGVGPAGGTAAGGPGTGGIDGSGLGGPMGEDEERVRDAMFWRLDSLGYRVGMGLSERWVCLTFLLCYAFSAVPWGFYQCGFFGERTVNVHSSRRYFYTTQRECA